jgi:hypothetical protein
LIHRKVNDRWRRHGEIVLGHIAHNADDLAERLFR